MVGVSVGTLHHYDELGLLRPSERSDAGYRLYSDGDLRRLHDIVTWRSLGFPLDEVKALGYRVLATSSHEQAGSQNLHEADLSGAVCVVLGSEAHGVSAEHASSVDGWIRIDHAGRAESLNVAMAATIISYEMARARS